MNQASFSQLVNNLEKHNNGLWTGHVSENWMQGRTTYGGLSAALCLSAVQKEFDELPPLRSAQINFVGPVGGDISIDVSVMRRGKSVAFISAQMTSEKGLATHAIFCFGVSRESRLNEVFATPVNDLSDIPAPEQSKRFFADRPGPKFSENFECLLAKGGFPLSGSSEFEHYIWVRHKDQHANDLAALIGIADMPPPAVLPMFKEFAPISSMTWMINFAHNNLPDNSAKKPELKNDWWLMRSAGEYAVEGYSSQDMQIWNQAGELIITGRQNVAIFY